MLVKRAQSAGFCLGVSLALRALDHEIDLTLKNPDAARRIVTLGPIIHNPLVMRHYQNKGVVCLDSPKGILPGDRVIIRAHGIPVEEEKVLSSLGSDIVDATCPKVKKAQTAIAGQRDKNGGTLLLFGEAEHPEVRGLVSYAGGDALVFGSLEELEELMANRVKPDTSYFLAAQTTQDNEAFQTAHRALESRLGRPVPLLDTICNATRRRQEEAIVLAGKVEAMVVVGGKNSGNTRRLAEVAGARGIPAVHVEEVAELDPALLAGARVVGLTAGASTPRDHIDAMHRFLESL